MLVSAGLRTFFQVLSGVDEFCHAGCKVCIENIFKIFEFLKSFLRANDEEFFYFNFCITNDYRLIS